MIDLIYLALIIGFFLAAIGYLAFCERLGKGDTNQ